MIYFFDVFSFNPWLLHERGLFVAMEMGERKKLTNLLSKAKPEEVYFSVTYPSMEHALRPLVNLEKCQKPWNKNPEFQPGDVIVVFYPFQGNATFFFMEVMK